MDYFARLFRQSNRVFFLNDVCLNYQIFPSPFNRESRNQRAVADFIYLKILPYFTTYNKIRVIRVYLIRTAYFVLIHPCVKEGFNERQYQFPSFSINSARLRHSYRNFSYELGELFYVQLVNCLMPPFERERAPLYNKIHINRAPYVGWVWSHQTCSRFASAVQFMLANLS